jgi:hypothetical protein
MGELMKKLLNLRKLTVLLLIGLSLGCAGADSGGGNSGGGNSGGNNSGSGSSSGTGKSCDTYTPISGAYDSAQRHVYLGEFRLDKNSGPQGTYRNFLGDFGLFCNNNSSGFKWQHNQNTGKWEFAYNWSYGTSNCNYWDDFFKLWIIFPRNDARRAHLVVDATMSGYPDGWTGQGYDVQRISLPNAQIDCNEKEKTVIYFEPSYGSQFKVEIYQGSKNSERQRAEVFYKNSSIGKSDFFIIQN